MNPFPEDNSVLVLDNCAIHKSDALRAVVEAQGHLLIFLPPYSPDFNPIEESFSCGMCFLDIRTVY
jgi:transposase